MLGAMSRLNEFFWAQKSKHNPEQLQELLGTISGKTRKVRWTPPRKTLILKWMAHLIGPLTQWPQTLTLYSTNTHTHTLTHTPLSYLLMKLQLKYFQHSYNKTQWYWANQKTKNRRHENQTTCKPRVFYQSINNFYQRSNIDETLTFLMQTLKINFVCNVLTSETSTVQWFFQPLIVDGKLMKDSGNIDDLDGNIEVFKQSQARNRSQSVLDSISFVKWQTWNNRSSVF